MRWTRLGMAGAMAFAFASTSPEGLAQDQAKLGEQIVDVMNKLFGTHPGTRANHAKGVVVEGSFTPSGAGAKLTKAALFQGAPTPVIARFSAATGVPAIPDGDPNANPHGLSVEFRPADGKVMDIVANSLKLFPVATGEEFLALLQAIAASGPDAPKPNAADRFIAAHPSVPRALDGLATPVSYARERYNGVNAFVFVDAAGGRHPFRFRLAPVEGEAHLSAGDAGKQKPSFLEDELRTHLAAGPVRFRVLAQLARPGDPTADPTQPWPEDRELADLGEIALTRIIDEPAKFGFLPGNLVDGVEPSDDPMIGVRNATYAVSYDRRTR